MLQRGLFDVGFDRFWSDLERTSLPVLRWSFQAALLAATWIAPLLIRRLPPLTLYDRPIRERALTAMGASRWYLLRAMLAFLKTTVCYCYGADPGVRDAIGYPLQPAERHTQVMP